MSLIKCPECNKEISEKAQKCPYCGYPFSEVKVKKMTVNVLYIIIIFLCLAVSYGIFLKLNKRQKTRDYDALLNQLDYNRTTTPQLSIYDVDIQNIKYTGDEVKFTIKNNSKYTISYVKFDIYLYDQNNNIVDTDWTNWSGSLLSEGKAVVETYINDEVGAKSISISVDEVKKK